MRQIGCSPSRLHNTCDLEDNLKHCVVSGSKAGSLRGGTSTQVLEGRQSEAVEGQLENSVKFPEGRQSKDAEGLLGSSM